MYNVGIIVPSFNTKDYLENLLRTLQNYKNSRIKLHIVVVENGSSDGSKEFLRSIQDIMVVDNIENKGYTRAINQGIEKIEASENSEIIDYYVFLNTDVRIHNPDMFIEMCKALDKDQSYGCCIMHDAVIGENAHLRLQWINDNIAVTDEGMWYCVMIPKRIVQTIGVLDENFFLHCSDSDYQIRIRNSGFKVIALRNKDYISHFCFASSRKLPNIHSYISNDRNYLTQKSKTYKQIPVCQNVFPVVRRISSKEKPFLTIFTRHYKRPTLLKTCQQSILHQSDQDWEQILLIDNVGRGLGYANSLFGITKDHVQTHGQYMMVLDDDDMIIYHHLIRDLKKIQNEFDKPAAIIFKGLYHKRTVPSDRNWELRIPIPCDISSFCFAVRRDVWYENILEFGSDKAIGDFKFIREVYEQNKNNIYWLDRVCAQTQRLHEGCGLPE